MSPMSSSTRFGGELVTFPCVSIPTLSHGHSTSSRAKDKQVGVPSPHPSPHQPVTDKTWSIFSPAHPWNSPLLAMPTRPVPAQALLSLPCLAAPPLPAAFPASILGASASYPPPTWSLEGDAFLNRSDHIAYRLCNLLWLPCGLEDKVQTVGCHFRLLSLPTPNLVICPASSLMFPGLKSDAPEIPNHRQLLEHKGFMPPDHSSLALFSLPELPAFLLCPENPSSNLSRLCHCDLPEERVSLSAAVHLGGLQ